MKYVAKKTREYFLTIVFYIKPIVKNNGRSLLISSLLIALLIVPLNSYISISIQQKVIDGINAGNTFAYLISIIVVYYLLDIVAISLGPFYTQFYAEKRVSIISRSITQEIYKKALKTDIKFFDDEKFYNKYTYAVNEYSRRCFECKSTLQSFISCLISISIIVHLMGQLSPFLIVITVITTIISTIIGTRINKINQAKIKDMVPNNRQAAYIQRVFYQKDYTYDLKCTLLSVYLFRKYKELFKSLNDIYNRHNPKLAILTLVNSLLFGFMNIFIMILLTYQVTDNQISIGSFVAMITASSYLRLYLTQLMGYYQSLHNLNLYKAQIEEFFTTESPIENSTQGAETKKEPWEIQFKNVSFSYPNSNFGLKNIDITIPKNKKIAIVGINGAGKTTLVKLLLRLYEPSAGDIFVNGVSNKSYRLDDYRRSIGTVFQNASVYALSLNENIQLVRSMSEEQLNNALDKMNIAEILKKNNATLNSPVTKEFDNNGIILSGGETQRVTLSRVCTGDFSLLIYDEPSAALDPIAQYQYIEAMMSNSTTSVIVTHRLSLAEKADYIYVMDGGQIVEKGNHTELLNNHGLYFEMYEKQARSFSAMSNHREKSE